MKHYEKVETNIKIWKVWQKACESKLFHSEWRLYRKPFIGVVLRMSQVDDFEVMKRHMRGGISWNPEILFRFIGILMAFYNPYNKRYCICILCFTKNIFFFGKQTKKTRLQKNCHLILKEGASKGETQLVFSMVWFPKSLYTPEI